MIRRIIYALVAVAGLIATVSCRHYGPWTDEYPEGEKVRVQLELESNPGTKSILGDGVESVDSGLQLIVFFHDSGKLEGVYRLDSKDASVSLTSGRPLDFYVIGNMWFLDKYGQKAGWAELLGEDFPSSATQLSDLNCLPAYRFDGKAVNGKYRTETFAEVAQYGIPYAGSNTDGEKVIEGTKVIISARRLFSKVSLVVDHGAIDAGVTENFKNGKLHIRQANCRIHPFVPLKAESADDILVESDYNPAMANARALSFTFYVPENRQKNIGFVNLINSPAEKSLEQLNSQGKGELAKYLTYMEFTAKVNQAAGGYGGDYTYRFYLGKNNLDDFDVEGNVNYNVTLTFKVNSLFDPVWKVNGNMTDTRKLCLSEDAQGSRLLPEGKVILLRANRPASAYVYFNREGAGASNEYSSYLDSWTSGYEPENLTRSAFAYEIGGDLAQRGISTSFDPASGLLSLTVTDPSRFVVGEDFPLTLTLYPGGKTFTATVRTYDSISIDWDASLTEEFAPGMKRTATIKGFSSPLQVCCTEPWMYKYKLSEGTDNLIKSTYARYGDGINGTFNLYNYYYRDNTKYSLKFRPEDSFNDGSELVFEIKNTLPEPKLRGSALDLKGAEYELYWSVKGFPTVFLDMDGADWVQPLYVELYFKGQDSPISYSKFDPDLFRQVWFPRVLESNSPVRMVSGEEVLQDGAPESFITMELLPGFEGQYPRWKIYRHRIGDLGTVGKEEKIVRRSCLFRMVPPLAEDGSGQFPSNVYKSNINLTAYLRPFLDVMSKLEFKDRYDDYTIWRHDMLDSPYQALRTSSANGNEQGGRVRFNIRNKSSIDLYAKPLSEHSKGYDKGRSDNFLLSAEPASGILGALGVFEPLKLSFSTDGNVEHSAGPHDIIARVKNMHSGEYLEARLNTEPVNVFVHFAAGLDYDRTNSNFTGNEGLLFVVPRVISDISKTSFGDSKLNTEHSKSVEAVSTDINSTMTLELDSGKYKYDVKAGDPKKKTAPLQYGVPKGSAPIRTFTITPQSNDEASKNRLANFFTQLKREDMISDDVQKLAYALAPQKMNMKFAYSIVGASGTESESDTYDLTGFGTLHYFEGNVKKGYYVFHYIGDIFKESRNWVPYAEWMAR